VSVHTNFRRALRPQDIDALDDGGARVVDAVDEGLAAARQFLSQQACKPSSSSSYLQLDHCGWLCALVQECVVDVALRCYNLRWMSSSSPAIAVQPCALRSLPFTRAKLQGPAYGPNSAQPCLTVVRYPGPRGLCAASLLRLLLVERLFCPRCCCLDNPSFVLGRLVQLSLSLLPGFNCAIRHPNHPLSRRLFLSS
jgi:hypothetical protein